MLEKISQCENEIFEKELQNSQIMFAGQVNPSDTTDFNKYDHLCKLKLTSENMLNAKSYKKLGVNPNQAREIIEMGKKSIEEQIDALAELDSVIYFVNLNEIKAQKATKEKLEAKLEEIQTIKAEALALQEDIKALCGEMTEDEIWQEAKRLQQETRIISDIHALSAKRNMLNHLTRTIRRNNAQFEKLEDYRNLKNAQYEEIISFIDVSNVF